MALTKQITLSSGVILTEGYMKISDMHYFNNSATNSYVEFNVNIFNSKSDRDQNSPEVTKLNYKVKGRKFDQYFAFNVLQQDGKNLISQGYLYLKTLKFYENATDVIDTKES